MPNRTRTLAVHALWSLALVFVLVLSGCGGHLTETVNQAPPPSLYQLFLLIPSSTMAPGATETVVVTGFAQNGQSVGLNGVNVVFTSSNPAIASVDAKGLVAFLKAGTATITAASANILSGQLVVTVSANNSGNGNGNGNPPTVTLKSITITPALSTIQANQTQPFLAQGIGTDGNPFAITPTFLLASGNGSVVGNIYTPAGVGTALVVASANGVTSAPASVTVVQVPPALKSITISPATSTIQTNQTQPFTAQGFDQYGNPFTITPMFAIASGSGSLVGNVYTPVQVGNASVTASAGGITSAPAMVSVVQVPPALKTITLTSTTLALNVNSTAVLTATGVDQYGNNFTIAPTFNVTGTAVTLTGSTVTGAVAGNASITATAGGVTSNAVAFVVGLNTQTITFGTLPTTSVALATLAPTATASSNLPVTIVSTTPAICSLTQALTSGTCTYQATQAGNAVFGAAPIVTASITITLAQQTINFTQLATVNVNATFAPAGTATSTLPVTFTSITPTICSTTTALAVGTCSIQFSQAGNNIYAPVTATMNFGVGLNNQTITFAQLPNVNTLAALAPAATSSSTLPVTITSKTPTVCSIAQALTAGTCTLEANQAGNGAYAAATPVDVSFTVGLSTGALNLVSSVSQINAKGTFTVTATLTPATGQTITYNATGCTVTTIGAVTVDLPGTCSVTATAAATNVYAAATSNTISVTINLIPQTITFPTATGAFPTFTVGATSDSGLTVAIQSDSASICTINAANVVTELLSGVCILEADQPGNQYYAAATAVTQNVNIGQTLSLISVTPATATAPQQFAALALDQFMQPLTTQPTFTWSVSDPTSASIDTTGNALPLGIPNQVVVGVTASANGVTSAPAQLTVNAAIPALTTVTLSGANSITAPAGSTVFSVAELDQFGRTMTPLVACTYNSSNTNAALIDANSGTATANNATPNNLDTNITATCGGLTTLPSDLTVIAQVRFAAKLIVGTAVSVMQTQSVSVPVSAVDEYGAPFSIGQLDVQAGFDTGVVSAVAQNGEGQNSVLVGGLGLGTTNVTVFIDTDDAVSATFAVTVTPCTPYVCYTPILTSVAVTPETLSMEYGATQTVLAVGTDQKGGQTWQPTLTFTYSSSATGVLTVDANGNVKVATNATNGQSATISASATVNGVTVKGTTQVIKVILTAPTNPTITSTFPTMAVVRTNGVGNKQYITINGTGFVAGAVVSFGSDATPANTVFKSTTELAVTVPATDLKTATTVFNGNFINATQVKVTNPIQLGNKVAGVSNAVNFDIIKGGMVTVTFDDAYASTLASGIPLFNSTNAANNIPVTEFVITGNYSGQTRSDGYPFGWNLDNCPAAQYPLPIPANELAPNFGCLVGVGQTGFMTWPQVKALAASNSGNEIGAHTRSHNGLSTVSPADLVGEVTGSVADLTANGITVRTLAYPYGDYGCLVNVGGTTCADGSPAGTATAQTVGTAVFNAGLKGARSSDFGLEGVNGCETTDDTAKNCRAGKGSAPIDLPYYLFSYAGDFTAGDANTATQLEALVQKAVTTNAWLVFLFHRVDEPCATQASPTGVPKATICTMKNGNVPNAISIDSATLNTLANYLRQNNVITPTFSQGMAAEGLNGKYQTPLLFPTE